jgi:hypothetical protein
MMSGLKDQIAGKVVEDMDFFKKIANKIPGFKGYIERQNRRDADKLVRDTLFNRFRELEDHVSALQRQFISQGQLTEVGKLEATAIKLRTFADRIHRARRGYAGLFGAVKVNEKELTRLYEYDATMLDLTDKVQAAIDNVEVSIGTDGMPASLRNLESLARECVETYNRREEILTGAAG